MSKGFLRKLLIILKNHATFGNLKITTSKDLKVETMQIPPLTLAYVVSYII